MTAQVHHDPGHISQERDWNGRTDEGQERLDHTQAYHIVPALRAITWRNIYKAVIGGRIS